MAHTPPDVKTPLDRLSQFNTLHMPGPGDRSKGKHKPKESSFEIKVYMLDASRTVHVRTELELAQLINLSTGAFRTSLSIGGGVMLRSIDKLAQESPHYPSVMALGPTTHIVITRIDEE